MKALVAAFNQEEALVGAFAVIVQYTDSSFTALVVIVQVLANQIFITPRQWTAHWAADM